jgi:hypothetical protein
VILKGCFSLGALQLEVSVLAMPGVDYCRQHLVLVIWSFNSLVLNTADSIWYSGDMELYF